MTVFDVPLQTEADQGPLLELDERPQADPSLTTPTTHVTDGGENNSTIPNSPLQRLLDLQLTLQKISTSSKGGDVRGFDEARSPGTAIEDTFIATDDLVAVIEELHRQATHETVHAHAFESRTNARGNAGRGNSCALGDGSTSLLVLNCYVCLLEIYEVRVASFCD
jgi:hypothetical protein